MPRLLRTGGAYLLLVLLAVLMLGPVAVMLLGSLTPDEQVLQSLGRWRFAAGELTLQNYADVFERVPFGTYLRNSFLINAFIVLLGALVNGFAGYALARLRFGGRRLLLGLVLALLVIPFEAIAVPLFFQLSWLGWRDTLLVQAAPFVASPLAIYLFYSFFLRFPRELEEAARIDGAGVLRTFFCIVLPNSKPVFASVAIVTFLFNWGMYLWPLLMTTAENVRPLPLGIADFYTLPPMAWGDVLAFGVMMILPVLAVFILLQRWFVRGVARSGIVE
jgi:multiple sugar transport system permease protein